MGKPKVVRSILNEKDKTTSIWFEDGSGIPNGRYFLKAGINMPICYNPSSTAERLGAVLLVGLHIDTGNYYVLEEYEFDTFEPIIENDTLISSGIVDEINSFWHRYYCYKFYCPQSEQVIKEYKKSIRRCSMINPKPRIVPVDIKSTEHPYGLIWDLRRRNKLFYSGSGCVVIALEKFDVTRSETVEPAAHALASALMGFTKNPYRG